MCKTYVTLLILVAHPGAWIHKIPRFWEPVCYSKKPFSVGSLLGLLGCSRCCPQFCSDVFRFSNVSWVCCSVLLGLDKERLYSVTKDIPWGIGSSCTSSFSDSQCSLSYFTDKKCWFCTMLLFHREIREIYLYRNWSKYFQKLSLSTEFVVSSQNYRKFPKKAYFLLNTVDWY